jgi:uncharacterized metal-binding protein
MKMKLKDYLPNQSSLKHYAFANIVTNLMVLVNLGFWMGCFSSLLLQFIIEINQFKNSKLSFKTYMKMYKIDTIWDTVFAILGIFISIVNVLPWV